MNTITQNTNAETVVTHPAPDTLDMRRRYAAPVALMWRLWTDPAHFARWWGTKGRAMQPLRDRPQARRRLVDHARHA